jgi:hypothetical protein
MKRKLITLLILCTILSTFISVPNLAEAKSSKGYLVLVHNDPDGNWTAYENLACASPKGNIMVKASTISKLLNLDYSTTKDGFKIADNRNSIKENLTFTKGNNQYSYYDGKKTVKKKSIYEAFTSKFFNPSANVIHFSTLKDLDINVSYFSKNNMTEKYKKLGYSGIICFSEFYLDSIEDLPSLYQVVDTKGNELVKLEPVKYDGYITVNEIEIPKLTGFSEAYNDPTGHWGADITKNTPLEDSIDVYAEKLKKDVANLHDEGNSGENADIKVNDSVIIAQVNGDSMLSSLRLYKTKSGFEIYLATRLTYTETDKKLKNANYTEISNNILKLFCYIVTSDGNLLYNKIYKASEEDSSIVSEDKYTTYGNFQIKVRVENRHALIYSIKAK